MNCEVTKKPETCIFDDKTTYLNDFRWCTPDKRINYNWPKKRCESPRKAPPKGEFRPPYAYKDMQMLKEWKEGARVPFYLYWEEKQSVNTDPRKLIKVPSKQKEEFERREEEEKLKSIKTRPRLYVSPAVSVDDIEDAKIRKVLAEYIYITDWEKNCRESCLPSNKLTFTPDVSAYREPQLDIVVKTLPSISSQLRKETKEWNSRQIRASIDPNELFWKNQQQPKPMKSDIVGALVPQETRQKITELMKQDKLRKEHDCLKPNYSGHKPLMNPGLPLKVNDCPVKHPMISVMQANDIRKKNVQICL